MLFGPFEDFRLKKKKKKGHEIDECIFVSGSQGLAVFYDNKVRS